MQSFIRILFFVCLVKPFLLVVLGINLFGRQNLPRYSQFIMVANHNSHLDALVLINLFPLQQLNAIHPVAAADYFLSNPLLAWFSKTCLNIIPIPRQHFTKTNNPLARMGEALQQGDSLIIFPEGSRGAPEEIAPFKSGIGHLIQKHPHIPVVPVFLKGLGRSLPKGEFILVPFFCDVVIGKPQFFHGCRDDIVDSVEAAVKALAATVE